MLAVNVGLLANAVLAIAKTGIGVLGCSPALLADGINSTSDVAYGIVVKVFMKLSAKPADHEHPYGHQQMESIAAVVVGAFVITTAIAIFWNTVGTVYDLITSQGPEEGASRLALLMALFTIVTKLVLSWWTKKIGDQTKNPAISALAHDHRNDVLASAAAAIGIFFSRMGHIWVDPLAGAMVSLVILHTGIEIIRSSAEDLMDTVPGKSLARQIHECLDPVEGALDIEEIHAHRFGPYFVVNITIGVDGSLTIAQGDAIASRVEHELIECIEFMKKVHVHLHPRSTSTPPEAVEVKDLPDAFKIDSQKLEG